MKKRIFIAIQYLEIGGVERSLIGMLNAIDYSQYDVDLFIYRHEGEFMGLIPKCVNLLPENKRYASLSIPLTDVLKRGYIDIALGRLFAHFKAKRFAKNNKVKDSIAVYQYVADFTTPFLPSLKQLGEYDLAISFLIPHNIVRDKVRAKRKWAWIHTDYSFVGIDVKAELPVWGSYDRIVSISEDVTKSFLGVFPSLKHKIMLMENILSEKFVREQAGKESPVIAAKNAVRLCSVGRFSYPKAFDRAVDICKGLCDNGIDVYWYIVGYGSDEPLIRKRIRELNMSENFVLIGKRTNPYPYIKACDIYVQPSRYEGKAVTVREAQILCKPVVITEYATAHSQVVDGIDGVIVPNNVDGAVKGVADFINDMGKREEIIDYLKNNHYGNECGVEKLKLAF